MRYVNSNGLEVVLQQSQTEKENQNNGVGTNHNGNDNEKEDVQQTFQEAVKIGDVDKVACLLKSCRININQPDWYDTATPPIIEVARSGNVELLKVLCENGCDPNVRSMRGETALQVAVNNKKLNMEIVGVLLSSGCNANIQENLMGATALHLFINRHIANNSRCSRRSNTANSSSSFADNDEQMQKYLAVITEMFRILVEYSNIDIIDYRYRTALHMIASAKCQYSTLNTLLQILLDCKPDLNIQNGRGETPLHEALENNNSEIAISLIKTKADLYLETKYRETALHIASRKNLYTVVRVLLEHDCPINTQDLNGNTALHLAAGRGFAEVVEYLLQNEKTQLNISNREGLTPLHLAVESGFIYVVQLLLKADACDVTAKTKRRETALDLAQQEYRRRSQPEMTEVLSREIQRRSCGKSL